MKKIFVVLIFFLAGISSCYYDKADDLYPVSSCDTTTVVSYAQKIVPLFQTQCYSCHLNASSGGGVLMGTYTADKAIALNGTLYGSIAHSTGFSPMPKGSPKFTACQIQLIKKWIDSGSPNN